MPHSKVKSKAGNYLNRPISNRKTEELIKKPPNQKKKKKKKKKKQLKDLVQNSTRPSKNTRHQFSEKYSIK
jgi:hypothetical protein